jgi:hypothetical protein
VTVLMSGADDSHGPEGSSIRSLPFTSLFSLFRLLGGFGVGSIRPWVWAAVQAGEIIHGVASLRPLP